MSEQKPRPLLSRVAGALLIRKCGITKKDTLKPFNQIMLNTTK